MLMMKGCTPFNPPGTDIVDLLRPLPNPTGAAAQLPKEIAHVVVNLHYKAVLSASLERQTRLLLQGSAGHPTDRN
jgi:hypothetical protein